MRGAVVALAWVWASVALATDHPDTVLHAAADPQKCLTIVIVSNRFPPSLMATDGTTVTTTNKAHYWEPDVTDQPSFKRCADTAVKGLFGREPFKTYEKAFQVVRVDVPSRSDRADQGAFRDRPQKTFISGPDKLFGNPTELDDNIYYLGRKYRSDNTMLIINERTHGGENFARLNVMTYDVNSYDFGYVAAHEVGHGLFGLFDEYTEKRQPPANMQQVLASFPNIDFSSTLEQTKWAKWKGVDEDVKPKMGGGGYVDGTNIWHPTKECLMNNQKNAPYCIVCREAAIAVIQNRVSLITRTTPPTDKPVTIAGGGVATFSVSTDYAGSAGIVVDWILDGKNLLQRSGKSITPGSGGQGILSVDVTATDLQFDGDHELIALVRDSKAHPQTKSQPVEAVWNIKYGPLRRREPELRPLR